MFSIKELYITAANGKPHYTKIITYSNGLVVTRMESYRGNTVYTIRKPKVASTQAEHLYKAYSAMVKNNTRGIVIEDSQSLTSVICNRDIIEFGNGFNIKVR